MQLIGLIGGTGWPATRDYYEQINRLTNARLGGLHGARLLVWSFDFQAVLDKADQPGALDQQFAIAGATLKTAGAQVLALASNTGHLFVKDLQHAGLPLIHIAWACAQTLAAYRVTRVGILATRRAWQGGVFDACFQSAGIAVVYAGASLAQRVDEAIFNELETGNPGPLTCQVLTRAADEFAALGITDILLGCTELRKTLVPPELLAGTIPGRPVLRFWDSTDIHCAAIVDAALTPLQNETNA